MCNFIIMTFGKTLKIDSYVTASNGNNSRGVFD